MNPFEKIFNYQILSRLAEAPGAFMVTTQERSWLKTVLEHPAAADAFSAETLAKLHLILREEEPTDTAAHLVEKARSMERQVYHPLIRSLRRAIMERSGVRLSYSVKGGRPYTDQPGFPYKLEYSMVKREWYLLWYHLRHRTFMSTRLQKITSVRPQSVAAEEAKRILLWIQQTLEGRRMEAVIEVVPEYHKELSRILYALSCFEKDVTFNESTGTYRIKVCILGDEQHYLLTKLRFLGKRVRIIEGDYLHKRMLESSRKALARYGELEEETEGTRTGN